jgi:hypothetical protein
MRILRVWNSFINHTDIMNKERFQGTDNSQNVEIVRTRESWFLVCRAHRPSCKNPPNNNNNIAFSTRFRVEGFKSLHLFLLRHKYLKIDMKAYYVYVLGMPTLHVGSAISKSDLIPMSCVVLYTTKLYIKLVCNFLLVLDKLALNVLFHKLSPFNQYIVHSI